MDALRVWILGVAAGSFSAGMIVGHTVTHATCSVEASPEDAAYAAKLAADYGLSAEQLRRLRLVLQHAGEQELVILRRAQATELPKQQMLELLQLRNATEQRIRKLLDDQQRARYDRDSRPGSAPAAAGKR